MPLLPAAQIAGLNAFVGIDAAVPKEGPVPACVVDAAEINPGNQNGVPIVRSFGQDDPGRIADERPSQNSMP